jgi:transportin-3
MAGLTVVHSDIIFAALDLFQSILLHDSLDSSLPLPHPPKFPIYAASIRVAIEKEGFTLLSLVVAGIVGEFPADSTAKVVSIFRVLAHTWPSQLLTWLPRALEQLPTSDAPAQAKAQFLQDVTR